MNRKLLLLFSMGLFLLQVRAKESCVYMPPPPSFVFWQPELAAMPDYSALYFSFERFYDYKWDEPAARYKTNTQEWKEFASFRPTDAEIDSLLFNGTEKDFENLVKLSKTGAQPTGKWRQNAFAQVLTTNKMTAALDYLLFAKRCEAQAVVPDYWEAETDRKPADMRRLYQQGQAFWEKESNAFLKNRYAYQCVRMAHYAGDNMQAIGMYDKMLAAVKTNSVVKDWALGHKAGALLTAGKVSEAMYLFSRLFESCPSKRINYYLSFRIDSDERWEQVMGMCKNEKEKATLFLLRAINPSSQTLEEMENIYSLEPKSEYLNLLLVREINKMESALMHIDFNFEFPVPVRDKADTQEENPFTAEYLNKFSVYVDDKVQQGQIANPQLWKLAQAYLAYLKGEYRLSLKQLNLLEAEKPGAQIQSAISKFKFLLEVAELKAIDAATEDKLFNNYLKLGIEQRANYADDWEFEFAEKPVYDCFRHKLIVLYNQMGWKGKALMIKEGIHGFYAKNTEMRMVDELLKMVNQQNTSYERYLTNQIMADGLGKDHLLDVKGTILMRQGKFKEAAEVFEQMSDRYMAAESNTLLLHADPFKFTVMDCHECAEDEFAADKSKNKVWLAKEMAALQANMKTGGKTAENAYKMGLACYNMTYYGPAWRALMFQRSGSDSEYANYEEEGEYFTKEWIAERRNAMFDDMLPALGYLELAAKSNPDKELGAKIQIVLAKARQNQRYQRLVEPTAIIEAYRALVSEYSATATYKQFLKECKYFASYIRK